ncbi:MAG TPA: HAD family hydrolase [Longimicrobiales bacterium]|nr:HAD family hydrolase [Longimicrobiales bacterium]
MDRVAAVLFDLDGTLLDRRATFRHHLELQIARYPRLFGGGNAERYVSELLALDENGTLDRNDFYSSVEQRFGLAPGAAVLLRSDFKSHFPELCVPFRDVVATLVDLKARGLKLGVVTNGSVRTQTRKIDGLGIGPYLDCIVISEGVGCHKPDRRIFEIALAQLCTAAFETVFVGDNPPVDVTGAKNAGLRAVWKRDDFWPEPRDADLVIEEVCSLPAQLDRIRPGAG